MFIFPQTELLHLLPQAIFLYVFLALLVDGGIHEESQQHGSGAIDGHRYRSLRVSQIETAVQFLGIVHRSNAHTTVSALSINIWPVIGIFPIQSDAVKRR